MPNSVVCPTYEICATFTPTLLSILGCDNLHLFVLFHYLYDQPFDCIMSIAKQKSRKCFGPIFHAEITKVILILSNT